MEWNVELLGGLRLHAQGQIVARFRTQRAASLLAYLCFYPRQHARDTLADLFWPDTDIDSARASLRQALSQIRASVKTVGLDPDTLLDTPGKNTVGIDTRFVRTDVAAFLEAAASGQASLARQRYGGPLLPGLWDDWLLEERDRLEALYRSLESATDAANLLLPLSRFFGRQTELAQLEELLSPTGETRLVTLLGAGGVGKTRLSLAVADRLREPFCERVGFVSLAALTDSKLLLMAILTGLEIPAGQPDEDPLEQLARFVGNEPYLLVLDNLEQLASAVAAPLQALLARVPHLTCLATSRRKLGLEGERLLPLEALAPDESVALFCDRAGIRPDDSVERLCALLEGIPLALELAANRVGALTVEEMIRKIGERLTFLTTQDIDKTDRHRSLHAVMDWSVRLLTADQRRFFSALSVFRGGWTTESAETVCDEPAALEYLSQLRDRSLTMTESRRGATRWRMNESLREFGESLLTPSEHETLIRRHGEHLTDFARARQERLLASDAAVFEELEAETDNFRFALQAQPPGTTIELCSYLVNFWTLRNHAREAIPLLHYFREGAPQKTEHRIRLLTRAATLFQNAGNMGEAIRWGEEGLALCREIGTNRDIVHALRRVSDFYNEAFRLEESRPLLEEAIQRSGQENDLTLTAECEAGLGWLFYRQNDFENAILFLEKSLAAARAAQRKNMIGVLLHRLSAVYASLESYAKVNALCEENIQIQTELNNLSMLHVCYMVSSMAYAQNGQIEKSLSECRKVIQYGCQEKNYYYLRHALSIAARCYKNRVAYTSSKLIGVCYSISDLAGLPASDALLEVEDIVAELRQVLGDDAYELQVAEGRAMSFDEASAFIHDL